MNTQAAALSLPALIEFPCEGDAAGEDCCTAELTSLFASLPPSVSLRVAVACPLNIAGKLMSACITKGGWWTDLQLTEEWDWASRATDYAEVSKDKIPESPAETASARGRAQASHWANYGLVG